jgi:hypothetical protein
MPAKLSPGGCGNFPGVMHPGPTKNPQHRLSAIILARRFGFPGGFSFSSESAFADFIFIIFRSALRVSKADLCPYGAILSLTHWRDCWKPSFNAS